MDKLIMVGAYRPKEKVYTFKIASTTDSMWRTYVQWQNEGYIAATACGYYHENREQAYKVLRKKLIDAIIEKRKA